MRTRRLQLVTCEHCPQVFLPDSPNAKFCGDPCRAKGRAAAAKHRAGRPEKTSKRAYVAPKNQKMCGACADFFLPETSGTKFCSAPCKARGAAQAAALRVVNGPREDMVFSEKLCVCCYRPFTPVSGSSRFCGDLCRENFEGPPRARKRAAIPPKLCVACSAVFEPTCGSARFCGDVCRASFKGPRRGALHVQKPCAHCQDIFEPTSGNAKFCGDLCKIEGARLAAIARLVNSSPRPFLTATPTPV